jgi:hypothetical protein
MYIMPGCSVCTVTIDCTASIPLHISAKHSVTGAIHSVRYISDRARAVLVCIIPCLITAVTNALAVVIDVVIAVSRSGFTYI